MSDLVSTALGLGFTLLVCLLALQAILSPWLRVRRAPERAQQPQNEMPHTDSLSTQTPETTPVHS